MLSFLAVCNAIEPILVKCQLRIGRVAGMVWIAKKTEADTAGGVSRITDMNLNSGINPGPLRCYFWLEQNPTIIFPVSFRLFDHEHFDGHVGVNQFEAELVERRINPVPVPICQILASAVQVKIQRIGAAGLIQHRHVENILNLPGQARQGAVAKFEPAVRIPPKFGIPCVAGWLQSG